MREPFDAAVIGRGPAACVFAKTIADAGGRVALLDVPRRTRREVSDWMDFWLVPLGSADAAVGGRVGIDDRRLMQMAEQVLPLEAYEATSSLPQSQGTHTLVAAEDFCKACGEALESSPGVYLYEGCEFEQYLVDDARVIGVRARSSAGETLCIPATVVIDTTRATARVDVQPTDVGLFDVMIWGRYQGVAREASATLSAMSFRGRSESRFWLVPISDCETHLGVEILAHPASRILSPAQLWEDELVGCHAAAQRLMDAKLVEACQLQRACYPHGAGRSQDGLVSLAELSTPSPLAFRWSVLADAVKQAHSVLRDADFERLIS